jgi:hypothetical protein
MLFEIGKIFVAIATKFRGNRNKNPAQVKKPIRGNIDELSWQYRRKSCPILKKMKIMETWKNFME